MKCENAKRWDVLSIGFLKSPDDDVTKHIRMETTIPGNSSLPNGESSKVELKSIVPPLAFDLPTDQLEKIMQLPLLSRIVSLSQITQLCIRVFLFFLLFYCTFFFENREIFPS